MKSFNDFAENTKNDFYLIAIGTFLSGVLRIMAAVLLGFATYVFAVHIKDFFNKNPGFLSNPEHNLYKKNIFAGCGLCVLLVALILYSTISIFL